MNRAIYAVAYKGKKILNTLKFYYKSLEAKLKTNTAEMTTKTDMTYEDAVQTLNKLHPKKEIDFTTPCVRSKDVKYDVSIIVPVYNAEKNLETCIESLINQKTKFTYEIICVNDGSTDSSLEILNTYKKKIVVISQTNAGSSAARNTGMKNAQGMHFLFVDSDDILPQNTLNNLMSIAQKTGADIVQGSVKKCTEDGRVFSINKCPSALTDDTLKYFNYNMLGTAWGKLYKRELWEKIDFFDGYAYEDAIIWCDIYSQCKKIAYSKESSYIFRSSNNSLFKRQNSSNKCLDAVWILEEAVKVHKKMRLNEDTGWYQMILWQLSVGIVTRIGYLSNDEVYQASFIIAKHIAESLKGFGKTRFEGKNKRIYEKIEDSFRKMEYKKWIDYSLILSYTNCV